MDSILDASSSPHYVSRPRTANPKLTSLSFDSNQLPRSDAQLSPLHSGRQTNTIGEGSVIWSTEGVPQEDLVRPHTSNPRYVERSRIDTPRRDTPATAGDSPSRQSSVTTSAVLWASDATDITPNLLARPPTSNPWLARFLDGVPDAKAFTEGALRRTEILWSDKDIEDWRLLARPHASNPTYDASTSSMMPPVENPGSEILWSRDDIAKDVSPVEDAVIIANLRATVQAQQQRIADLEAHVEALQRQLLLHHDGTPTMSIANSARSPAAQSPGKQVDLFSLDPQPTQNGNSMDLVVPSPPKSVPPSSLASHAQRPTKLSHTSTGPFAPLASRAPVEQSPTSDAEKIIVDVDEDEDTQRELDEAEAKVLAAKAETKPARFVSKLRQTATETRPVARPDTAAVARKVQFDTVASASTRPVSAPVGRTGGHDCMPTTYAKIASEKSIADSAIDVAYAGLCDEGATFLTKAAFKRMYKRRASEYGLPTSDATLDRMLKPYCSKGHDRLSKEEFAVLYLQLQRW